MSVYSLNLGRFYISRNLSISYSAAAAKLLQSCPTLCDPIDSGPPGYPVAGILQARTLDWVAISFSNGWKGKVKVKSFSRVRLFMTPWSAAHQAPPSMRFSRQEYWSGVPLPSPLFLLGYLICGHVIVHSSSYDSQCFFFFPWGLKLVFFFKRNQLLLFVYFWLYWLWSSLLYVGFLQLWKAGGYP